MKSRNFVLGETFEKFLAAIAIIVAIVISGGAGYSFSNGRISTTTLPVTETTTHNATQAIVQLSTVTTSVTNTSQIQDLQQQIATLMNSSTLGQWKLGLIQKLDNVGVDVFYTNQTWTVSPNSNLTITQQVTDHNGTLYFSYASCRNSGDSSSFVNGQYQLSILLNSRGVGAIGSDYGPIPANSSSYSVILTNIGPQSVTCTGSLAFVFTTA